MSRGIRCRRSAWRVVRPRGANRRQDAVYPTSEGPDILKKYSGANKYVMRFARQGQGVDGLPAPAGEFVLMMRLYWPKETPPSILDGTGSRLRRSRFPRADFALHAARTPGHRAPGMRVLRGYAGNPVVSRLAGVGTHTAIGALIAGWQR